MDHKNLDVWKKSMDCVEQVYFISSQLPIEEKFGLASQMRRSAVSIPSNIAEGSARSGKGEK
ncbi:MAG: four helix bundle protein, partial [Bacteroidota bacterium]